MTVDELAQEIRRVDGSHSLGAGALAEALMPFILSRLDKAEAGLSATRRALNRICATADKTSGGKGFGRWHTFCLEIAAEAVEITEALPPPPSES